MAALGGIFIFSFMLGLSGAIMPGPMLVVVVGQTPRRGAIAGPAVVFGHGVLESLLVAAVILGLADFFSSSAVLATVALAGGALLLYMGVGMLRSAGKLSLAGATAPPAATGTVNVHPFWAGILTSLANPYWTLWWATIGLGYLLIARKSGPAGLAAFLAGHILADLVWYSAVSVVVARGKHWLSDSLYRGLIRCCAVILVFFAFYFGWYGFKGLGAV